MWFPACRNSKLVVSYGCSLLLIPITSINFVQPLFISALLLMNHICLMIFPNPSLVGQTTTFCLANWISRVFGLIIFQTYFASESQCCKKPGMITLWWTNIALENGHGNSGFSMISPLKMGGSFHSKMLVHQRVTTIEECLVYQPFTSHKNGNHWFYQPFTSHFNNHW